MKLKTDYWNKTHEWQRNANRNINIIILTFIIITINWTELKYNSTLQIIAIILMILYIVPQKLSYNKWRKQQGKKLLEELKKNKVKI